MKKGFLFSSSSKTSSASDHKAENESIPFITAKKDSSKSQHRFDDVQQAVHVSDAFTMNKGDLFVLTYFLFLHIFDFDAFYHAFTICISLCLSSYLSYVCFLGDHL